MHTRSTFLQALWSQRRSLPLALLVGASCYTPGCADVALPEEEGEVEALELGEQRSAIVAASIVAGLDLPGMVKVLTDYGTCSGMVISETAVLTAAHCVCTYNWVGGNVCPSTATIVFRKDPWGNSSRSVLGAAVAAHPDYNPSWLEAQVEHDLAVITLPPGSKPWHAVAFRIAADNPAVGARAVLAGFGKAGSSCSLASGTLRWDYAVYKASEDSGKIVNFGPREWCAGDSGGAALVDDGSLSPNKIFGVMSMESWSGDQKAASAAKDYAWIVSKVPDLPGRTDPAWQWVPPQEANDIGVGANGALWITSNTPAGSGNFTIQRWNNSISGFETVPGAAVRVAVDPKGEAWVVNAEGLIYRWSQASGSWTQLPGYATDIAVGANGAVWIIGSSAGPDHGVYTWNGSGWTQVAGAGVRIAVDPLGNPWVVASDTSIWRRSGGTWQVVPGGAVDISIGSSGVVWVLGIENVPGGHPVFRRNGDSWIQTNGSGTALSAARGAKLWLVNESHQVYRTL